MREYITCVIKDNLGRYVGDNSISYNPEKGLWKYIWSNFLTGGFLTYANEEEAKITADKLNAQSDKLGMGLAFHVEHVDLIAIMNEEHLKGIPKNPFITEYIKEKIHSFNAQKFTPILGGILIFMIGLGKLLELSDYVSIM